LQQETVFGVGGKDSAAPVLVYEELVVFIRVEAEQRESEAVLTISFSVAASGVAAQFGEDRNDLIFKVDREVFGAARCGEV
jgi:hypothetical protein